MKYYSDEELIQLVNLNPGFGIDRLLKKIYPNIQKKLPERRFYLVKLLNHNKEEYGEDLYEIALQQRERELELFSQQVTPFELNRYRDVF